MQTEVENYSKQFEKLYRKYYQHILNFVYSKVHNIYLAEDLTQETFLRVYNYKYLPDEEKGNFYNFLCTIARSRIYTYRRKMKESQLYDWLDAPSNIDIEQEIIKREFKEVLYKIVLALPEIYRYPCLLYSIMGYSYAEAAKECGISVGCLKSRLFRARKEMKENLNNYYN